MLFISVTTSAAKETVLHIFKRRMGLTKRGSSENEALTVNNVSVNQTNNFTVHETSAFVTLIIPAAQILHTKVSAKTTTRSCLQTRDKSSWWYIFCNAVKIRYTYVLKVVLATQSCSQAILDNTIQSHNNT